MHEARNRALHRVEIKPNGFSDWTAIAYGETARLVEITKLVEDISVRLRARFGLLQHPASVRKRAELQQLETVQEGGKQSEKQSSQQRSLIGFLANDLIMAKRSVRRPRPTKPRA
ncbi:hypothetical protein [Variibacter gotjawalensis]|uniref:hypothetical protein n=1 Tax=Variibacter gotjawalensis TaxID=1333996 RepID=UPI00102C66E2|nr:hypothetical protein [Variibacter gotjawalensis]NIK47866.1 hypothetical protein [Variibacter gotjawalensis]